MGPHAVPSLVTLPQALARRDDAEGHRGDEEPDKISLGFALSVDTNGRVLIGAAGTIRVQLEWRKNSGE